ncbi:hypothetical protein DYB25_011841 [Aphanomyces astaci]|uniref:Uncharacterized protein n=1 Tax=Aphanomyces astaci TaxID=112090 RepID=A0A396ZPI8_APHAT|nr:hypothetical protein DYB25_011841 [Aphanomyces astaci]
MGTRSGRRIQETSKSGGGGGGGRGGPYRLDKGHRVHQISQLQKDQVTKEAQEKAKAMADAALADQLSQIDMTNHELASYQQVCTIYDERGWLKHQSSGEWDDAKLVDGLSGDRNVFKRRGRDPFASSALLPLPKKLLFVMDYGRLERMLETTLMLMESLAGFDAKFDYAIMGHSGDAAAIPFVEFGQPPHTKKDRLKVY